MAARRGPARGEAAAGRAPSLPCPAIEERADVYARVTDAIVAAIEDGMAKGRDWRMPWHRRRDAGASPALPVNVARGAAYRGVNAVALWAAAEARGYPAGLWGTFRQWDKLGGRVRRGPWARAYAVFSAAQVDGAALPADRAPRPPEGARIAAAERFFAALPGLDLRHGGAAAFYAPATDHVQMPAFADFRTAEGYYGVLGHEATHWTGHPSRLARDLTGRFGSAAYAAEELVAELGAAFVLAALGLATEPQPDYARYVAGWLDLLRADRRALFTAASKAQAAADWLLAASAADAAPAASSAGPPPPGSEPVSLRASVLGS